MWRTPDEIEENSQEDAVTEYKFKVTTKEDVEVFETEVEEEAGKKE